MTGKPEIWDLEVDFIAVGSGIGGLSGAIVAHDKGLKTVVLEKGGMLGGTTALSGGEIWVPNNYIMKSQGTKDSREDARAYLDFMAGGYADPELAKFYLDVSPIACRYFGEKAGIRWKTIKEFPDYYYPFAPGAAPQGRFLEVEPFKGSDLGDWAPKTRLTPHMPGGITTDEMFSWGGVTAMADWDWELIGQRMVEDYRTFGPGLMAYFVKAALVDRQIHAYIDTPVRELVTENGAVIGVRAEREGMDFFIRAAKGVLLAIGGYDWNVEMARTFEHMPEYQSAAVPQVQGDNIIMCGEIGAAIASLPPQSLSLQLGVNIPSEEAEGKPLWRLSGNAGNPHMIMVNRYGRRFCDESFYPDYAPKPHNWDGCRKEHPNFPPYLIFDQNHRDKYPFLTYTPERPIPEELASQANTLPELADKLGIDADALEEEVTRYNEFCKDGVDKDFGRGQYPWANFMTGDLRHKPNPNMGPINRPPFYGVRFTMVSVGICAAGLKTNTNAQVMHLRGHPIPGLYAAGNSSALMDTGAGYQSGIACTRGMLWGYIAALHAAGASIP
ncbi:FAD-binding protein [Neptuniibacter sp.]|uniref:FAD-binding protein n=1 Tax=Neptuniibacter sp. TaxID=1962643 RepID=UPI0026291B7B|nr:FAD-binding protein [Neptuniibacter sp.]MCP4595989.1 FAD-binding protein [Neptuniibacter sp.]